MLNNFEYSFKIHKSQDSSIEVPAEILLHIFTFLKFTDLARASSVSRSWNVVANDSALWGLRFKIDYPDGVPSMEDPSNWKMTFKKNWQFAPIPYFGEDDKWEWKPSRPLFDDIPDFHL